MNKIIKLIKKKDKKNYKKVKKVKGSKIKPTKYLEGVSKQRPASSKNLY